MVSPTTRTYTYSSTIATHDALPIYRIHLHEGRRRTARRYRAFHRGVSCRSIRRTTFYRRGICRRRKAAPRRGRPGGNGAHRLRRDSKGRSEEHTSELQSLMRISYAVFCLKKKNMNYNNLQAPLPATKHSK